MLRKILEPMEPQRTFDTILADQLWPQQGIFPDPTYDFRHRAVFKVLMTIPQEGYEKLKAQVETFEWFIPERRCRGSVMPFAAGYQESTGTLQTSCARVLYLSPVLEKTAWDVIVGIVAHEVAHIGLNHNLFAQEYDKQEEECWEKVKEWGFTREVTKVRATHKWRDSWNEYQVRKLRGG